MHIRSILTILLLGVVAFSSKAGDVPRPNPAFNGTVHDSQLAYYWKAQPVENSAELLTLFLHTQPGRLGASTGRDSAPPHERETSADLGADRESVVLQSSTSDVPVVSVLRDTLGNDVSEGGRLTSIWLLTYSPIKPWERVFAAVPFFYWRLGQGSSALAGKNIRPFLDLTQPQNSLFYGITRNLLQWTLFDPLTMPIRASSRAYRANELDYERLHLEEAIGYLRHAPSGQSESELTQQEIDSVIARLDLRKQLLGGLVGDGELAHMGQAGRFDEASASSRNWELLRQLAERTGLFFEPLPIGGTNDNYAMLWFSPQAHEPAGVSHRALWKLLNIRDPWTDPRLQNWKGTAPVRAVDSNGSLLPPGESGSSQIKLIPLGLYSMDYPRQPFLLVDFRGTLHLRRHEMTQRAINEVTSGVIGISHFTNWYFYVAADAYDFVAARHGGVIDQAQRLDSYSRFRAALALDRDLDPDLRSEIQRRVNAMAINPLESSPATEMQTSAARYAALQFQVENGQLARSLDRQRRSELAAFGKTQKQLAMQTILHFVSFGIYTDRVPSSPGVLPTLKEDRELQANLIFLESVDSLGTAPEIAYDRTRLQNALRRVSSISPQAMSPVLQARTEAVLQRFQSLTADPVLVEDCRLALHRVNRTPVQLSASIRVRSAAVPEPAK